VRQSDFDCKTDIATPYPAKIHWKGDGNKENANPGGGPSSYVFSDKKGTPYEDNQTENSNAQS